jgi:hypothetical protein
MPKTEAIVVLTRDGAPATETNGKPSPTSGLEQNENATSAAEMICEHFNVSFSAPQPQKRLC